MTTEGDLSTPADQLCQCYVDDWLWEATDDAVSTRTCCDQWENVHAPGVKYSGTWDDVVHPNFISKVGCYKIVNVSRSAMILMVSSARPVGMIVASAKEYSFEVLAVKILHCAKRNTSS